MRVASTDGVMVEVHHLGGQGRPLLMCHATGFCARAYDPLAAELTRHFSVWGVDVRGHGDATAPDSGDFAWTGARDDVVAAVEAIGEPDVWGFGHSMGGCVLLQAEKARRGWLRSAYLFEPILPPAGFFGPANDNLMASTARRRRAVFPSRGDVLERYATRPPLNVLRADALAAYVQHGFADADGEGVRLKCSPEAEARTFENGSGVSVDDVAGLDVVTVVGVGSLGPEEFGPASFAPGVVAALPNARLVTYPHLGHFGPLQDPVTVGADMIEALT